MFIATVLDSKDGQNAFIATHDTMELVKFIESHHNSRRLKIIDLYHKAEPLEVNNFLVEYHARNNELRESIKAKLTEEERKVLGL